MVNQYTRNEISRLCYEPRGTFTGKEFKQLVVEIMQMTGIAQLPSESVIKSIIKYLTFVSPKMSLEELKLAYEMFNTNQIEVYLERPLIFNLRFVSSVVNEYHRIRNLVQHEKRIYSKPNQIEKAESSPEEWLEGLKKIISQNGELPIGYNWCACIDALISNNQITQDIFDDEQMLTVVELNRMSEVAVNLQERKEIMKLIENDAMVENIAAKNLINKLFKENKL